MTNENEHHSYDQLIDPSRVLEVPMKSWEASDENHAVLFTRGLGPCIGITIYDTAKKRGFMGHIANPNSPEEFAVLEEMFAAVRSTGSDVKRLKVWVRGGQSDEGMRKAAIEGTGIDIPQIGKDEIERRLKELMGDTIEKADIQYDTAPMFGNTSTMQRLDTETGEFVSRAYSIGEYQRALGELSMYGIEQERNG